MKVIESSNTLKEIGFRELRADADSIIDAVSKGQSYIVKRKSKALFKIVPLDEEVWVTVIDFTEISSQGIEIEAVLAAMEDIKQTNPKKYGRSNSKVSR